MEDWTSGGGQKTMVGARTSRAREDDVHGPPHHGAHQRPRRRRERIHQPHPVEPGDPGARRGTDERAFDSTGRTSLRYKVTRALCRVMSRDDRSTKHVSGAAGARVLNARRVSNRENSNRRVSLVMTARPVTGARVSNRRVSRCASASVSREISPSDEATPAHSPPARASFVSAVAPREARSLETICRAVRPRAPRALRGGAPPTARAASRPRRGKRHGRAKPTSRS